MDGMGWNGDDDDEEDSKRVRERANIPFALG
jgi:hypothetical protein